MPPTFSVITPTHDARWLAEAHASLAAQTDPDWEWVVVPNGDPPPGLPAAVAADPRVRVRPAPAGVRTVGGLKRFGFLEAEGVVLVEFDHDDLLAPNCLAALRAAAAGGPGLYYSDFAAFYDNHAPHLYPNACGWETYKTSHAGREYVAHRAFPPDARSLYQIEYAPNHVRAWHRDAYLAVGGHDPTALAGDDFDLVVRTYVHERRFRVVHVPECLYLQRMHDSTHRRPEFARDLGAAVLAAQHAYFHKLVDAWLARTGLPGVDLSGAATGLPLPHPDGSVGRVTAHDTFAMTPRDRFVGLVNEVYRVLAPGGWLCAMTPSTDGWAAFADPRHVNFLNQASFWHLTHREYADRVPGLAARFQAARHWTGYKTDYARANKAATVFFDAVALKGQRTPGPVAI